MDIKEFKKLFSKVAIANGFTAAYGGWFRESPESVVVLDLQKSNFGNYVELNIKVFVQGLFGTHHTRNKEMVKALTGDVFFRPPELYRGALDLDDVIPNERKAAIKRLFHEFVMPITADALSRAGLGTLAARGSVHVLPAVRRELGMPSD
jgi:hypothetical protein